LTGVRLSGRQSQPLDNFTLELTIAAIFRPTQWQKKKMEKKPRKMYIKDSAAEDEAR